MKIIALEEHTVDRAIGAATAEVCKNNVPYLDTFYRADMPATPSAASLFKMGDYPYIPQDEARQFLENAPLTEADKEKFAYGNAAKLLHL